MTATKHCNMHKHTQHFGRAWHDGKRGEHGSQQRAGCGRNGGSLPLLGSARGFENSRGCLSGNRQVEGKSGQNSYIPYWMGLAVERGFWGRGVCANTTHVTAHRSSRRLCSDNSRRAMRLSGSARAELGKCWPFSRPVAALDRAPASRSVSALYNAGTPEVLEQCAAQERPTDSHMRQVCERSVGSSAGHACNSLPVRADYNFGFLKKRDRSLAKAVTCSTSLGTSPIVSPPLSAPFCPVRCSKIESLGTNEGLPVSLAGGFLSLISFLIESVASLMMEGAGVFGNMRPCQPCGGAA